MPSTPVQHELLGATMTGLSQRGGNMVGILNTFEDLELFSRPGVLFKCASAASKPGHRSYLYIGQQEPIYI